MKKKYLFNVMPLFIGALLLLNLNLNAQTPNVVVAKDGSGDVSTVQAAFDRVPSNNSSSFIIYVKAGTYKQKLQLASGRNHVTLIGENTATTILTYDDNASSSGSTPNSSSTWIRGDDFLAQNITFQNTNNSGQAVALYVSGDRHEFYDCVIKGFQDTFLSYGKGRAYFKCCTIKGTTDFICGDGVNIFEDCTIVNLKSSATTAAYNKNSKNTYNFLFIHCDITAEGNISCVLGRPWGKYARTVFYECYEGAHIKGTGWQDWSSESHSATAYYAEYNCSGPGYKPNVRISWSHQLNSSEASIYTVKKMFAKNANDDSYSSDWMPTPPNGACGSTTTNYSISTSVNGQGSVSPISGSYSSGSLVTLTATPASGWYFVNWSGGASGSSNPVTITMNSNISVTANFSQSSSSSAITIQENETGFCSVDGSIDNNNSGYTGAGFANTDNASGKGMTWSVNVSTSGNYNVLFRYANGGSSDRTAQFMVDGSTVVSNIGMSATGSWTNWTETSAVSVYLSAGTKLLRLQATNSSGLANIDYISISGESLNTASCSGLKSTEITNKMADAKADPDIKCYPNPVNDQLNIRFSQEIRGVVDVNLYDATGKIVLTAKATEYRSRLNMKGLSNGLYLLKITGKNMDVEKQIVKK